MIRWTAVFAAVWLLTGCTGDRAGVLDPIMDPPDPTVTVPATTSSLVPPTDVE